MQHVTTKDDIRDVSTEAKVQKKGRDLEACLNHKDTDHFMHSVAHTYNVNIGRSPLLNNFIKFIILFSLFAYIIYLKLQLQEHDKIRQTSTGNISPTSKTNGEVFEEHHDDIIDISPVSEKPSHDRLGPTKLISDNIPKSERHCAFYMADGSKYTASGCTTLLLSSPSIDVSSEEFMARHSWTMQFSIACDVVTYTTYVPEIETKQNQNVMTSHCWNEIVTDEISTKNPSGESETIAAGQWNIDQDIPHWDEGGIDDYEGSAGGSGADFDDTGIPKAQVTNKSGKNTTNNIAASIHLIPDERYNDSMSFGFPRWKEGNSTPDVSTYFAFFPFSGRVIVLTSGTYRVYAQRTSLEPEPGPALNIRVNEVPSTKFLVMNCTHFNRVSPGQNVDEIFDVILYDVYRSCSRSQTLELKAGDSVDVYCEKGCKDILPDSDLTFWGLVKIN